MFSIANSIAYDNQMVQATTETSLRCVLGDSAWFDVQGTSADKQIVEEEIQLLEQLVDLLRGDWPMILPTEDERLKGAQEKSASVCVISPFKRVTWAAKEVLKRCNVDERIKTGTIHTFQGREANIVIIVLGSAPGAPGAGSRGWVANSPNILNVALTRAKNRVYVIGSRADWRECHYFSTLDRCLHAPTTLT
jgi:hypothetical protein